MDFALTSAMDDLDPFDALAASLSSARAAIRGAGAHEADLVRRHLLDAAASLRAAPGGHLRLRSAHFARSYASFARFLLLHVAVEWLPCFGAEDRRRGPRVRTLRGGGPWPCRGQHCCARAAPIMRSRALAPPGCQL